MRNSSIVEASHYVSKPLTLKSEVYRNGSTSYSNFRALLLNKEVSISHGSFLASGIIPEIQAFWYLTQSSRAYTLNIFRYDLDVLESIDNFPTPILFVKAFSPQAGLFTSKIQHCLLVVTETDLIVYGIDSETHCIINTDFSAKLYSRATCVDVVDGKIYVGCQNGSVYQGICKSVDFLNYKYLSLHSPDYSFFKALASVFSKKREGVCSISAGKRYLAVLSKNLTVYNVEGGIYKVYDIPLTQDIKYTNIQIVDESPFMFYCMQASGKRDFYTVEYLFSREPAVVEISEMRRLAYSTESSLLSIRTGVERSTVVLYTLNEDQIRNFSKSKPVENYEILTVYSNILEACLTESGLYLLTPNSIVHYLILDAKKFLLNCRTHETYVIYKNYGEMEFMIKYFQLLTENEDVSRLDGLCKNDGIKRSALFAWIYTLIQPVWRMDLYELKNTQNSDEASDFILDEIIKKLKILKNRLAFGYNCACAFIDEFIQTNFYVTLLVDYNIFFKESFESIMTQEGDFKTSSLKTLLDAFTVNQSIEPLLKTMQNNCPIYLPIENINMQRGLQLIKKDDRDSLNRSLQYLAKTKFDVGIINKFNELSFYYGSVYLIKENFDLDYETAVNLFKQSVKCKKALELGLEDSRESFLYPFFEAVVTLESFSACSCCDSTSSVPELLSISNPMFKLFLKDNLQSSNKVKDLYWKYLLVRNEKIEAIESLINLSERIDLTLDKKAEYLQTALSISTGTHLNSEVKLRIKLYEIQKELIKRSPSLKTSILLDSDTLYNDYCFEYPDLQIKVLDAINFKDEFMIRELFERYFRDLPLRECVLFLAELTNKKIRMVFNILIKKIKNETIDFCTSLSMAGFEYDEIITEVRNNLNSSSHPEVKVDLLKSLKRFSKFGEYLECEKMCEKNFGIKVYK